MILRDLETKSALRAGLKITNHPPTEARKTIRGILSKIGMGGIAKVVDQMESISTHDVTTTEAREERTMGLTELKILADARRDKTAVTAR